MQIPDLSQWYRKLESDDWQERQKAADILGAFGPQAAEAIPALQNRLASEKDNDVRGAIIVSLTQLTEDKATIVPMLKGYLDDETAQIRIAAARALALCGTHALAPLQRRLTLEDLSEVKSAIFGGLAAVQDDKAAFVPNLITLLENDDWEIRQASARALMDYGPLAKDALSSLWQHASTDSDIDVATAAIDAIRAIDSDKQQLIATCLDALTSETQRVTAATRLLRSLKLSDEERQKVSDALREYCRNSSQRQLVPEAFFSLFEIATDKREVADQLLADDDIDQDVKGACLFPLFDQLDPRVHSKPLATLAAWTLEESDDKDSRLVAIEFLSRDDLEIADDLHERLAGALMSALDRDGTGFYALSRVSDDALNVMLSNVNGWPQQKVGQILLGDAAAVLINAQQDQRAAAVPFVLSAVQAEPRWSPNTVDILMQTADLFNEQQRDQVLKAIDVARPYSSRVRGGLEQLSARLKEVKRTTQVGELMKTINEGDEETKIEMIQQLVGMDSITALRAVVSVWTKWIAHGEQDTLVQTTAVLLRYKAVAVSPLVDYLSQRLPPDAQTKRLIVDSVLPRLQQDPTDKVAPPDRAMLEQQIDTKWRTAAFGDSRLSLPVFDGTHGGTNGSGLKVIANEMMKQEIGMRELSVHQRIARQLAEMSDPRFFGERSTEHKKILGELTVHAVPAIGKRLATEEDSEIRENLARTLANVGGQASVDALAQAVAGEERKRASRQKLLADYYLEPSKKRSEEAASILSGAVDEAKKTLKILRQLNVSVFALGVAILIVGITVALLGTNLATRVTGALAGLGGLVGVLVQLIRDPLDRIQNAMGNLVQIETAFTSFIWELNLNGTYIQSQYVAEGVLTDDEIGRTVNRIEDALASTMNMVATYTKEGGQRIVSRITSLSPAAGPRNTRVRVKGQHLFGDGTQGKHSAGLIALNHQPVEPGDVSWNQHEVTFRLPADGEGAKANGTIWISLMVDGMETNALPFNIISA